MKIIIVGAGNVGSFLCKCLSEKGYNVTVIEETHAIASSIDEQYDAKVICGNGSSAEILVKAGVRDCDFYIAMTSDDRVNIVGCSIAKALGAKATIARIHDQTYSDNTLINYQFHFGIDFLVNPEGLCAMELAKDIRNPGRLAVERFAQGHIEVQQIPVTQSSSLTSIPLRDLELSPEVRVGYIQRGNETQIASSSSTFEQDDLVTFVGLSEELAKIKQKLAPHDGPKSVSIALFGGSESAITLIRLLSNPRFKILLIEREAPICEEIAEHFPHITVIHGDAASTRLLEEEQIGSYDYFIATTKNDEDNIMTTLLAKQQGVQNAQLIINRCDYEDILGQLKNILGIESIVSPRIATITELLHYISEEATIELATLPGDAGKILEVRVDSESPCVGKTIHEIAWPPDIVLVALLNQFHAKVPCAGDTILACSRIVVIAKQDSVAPLLELLT
tara:strand:- start:49981 stop:51330 length:1350 start_codon:yes stop_codon:yes gene_type:complete